MSTPIVAIRPSDAIERLGFMLSWLGEGELPVYVDGQPNPVSRESCGNPATPRRIARMAHSFDFDDSYEVALGLPRTAEYVYHSTILWAWISSGEQEQRAFGFSPAPTVVLRIGKAKERLLIWPLRNPLLEQDARAANVRIAYALHTPRTRGAPERLRVPLPGTFMRVGRTRPAPILLSRFDDEHTFVAQDVVGKLREPPPIDAWRERQST